MAVKRYVLPWADGNSTLSYYWCTTQAELPASALSGDRAYASDTMSSWIWTSLWEPAAAGESAWGTITGTLANQTDLQTALDGKQVAGSYLAPNGNGGSLTGLTKTQVGLANVDNTADANKPISTAVQTALDGKQPVGTYATGTGTASGTNTGDQTSVSGNAGTATALQTPRTINGVSFDGTANIVLPAGGEAFPVGSVFLSVVATNPGTLLGYGTWVAFGAGRMLVGLDSGDPSFDTVEETGGAKTHTLTTTEIPAHNHQTLRERSATTGGTTTLIARTSDTSSTVDTNVFTENTGSGGAHNNLPPYIVVYMWKRTA